jgi:glycosyltransferase involved in cell wall biosynthesis
MNTPHELTIVIPAKNEERLLPRLLASLVTQDYPQIRDTNLLIADAGSTDRTLEIAAQFRRWLNVRVIPGGLPSVGRNNGARAAASRYVLFLDADIELADHTLVRRAVELMKQRSLHCVTTDIFCKNGGLKDQLLYSGNNLVQRLSRFHKPFATGMFMLVDKTKFDELGGFDEQALYAEDYQLTRQIARCRFRTIRGGIYSTNRRFCKMGHAAIVRMFLSTALHCRRPEYFRQETHRAYWQAY